MRVRNGADQRWKFFWANDLLHSVVKSLAVGVCCDDDQVGARILLPNEIPHIVVDLGDYSSVAAHSAPPVQSHFDVEFDGDPAYESADHKLMCEILGKKRDFTHQNPLSGCVLKPAVRLHRRIASG